MNNIYKNERLMLDTMLFYFHYMPNEIALKLSKTLLPVRRSREQNVEKKHHQQWRTCSQLRQEASLQGFYCNLWKPFCLRRLHNPLKKGGAPEGTFFSTFCCRRGML